MPTATVQHAERLMTRADWGDDWIDVTFADGRVAHVLLSVIRDDDGLPVTPPIVGVAIPDPYLLLIELEHGKVLDAPWDFVRHYTDDAAFRAQEQHEEERGRAVIGERIRRARESVGLSQSEAARRSGVGRVTLNRIEQGTQTPSYETLLKLAETFEMPTERLFSRSSR